MSERANLFKSESDLDSKSNYKTAQELTRLIRGGKREAFPGIPQLSTPILVDDDQGPCEIEPEGMDWLELSLLVMNQVVTIPAATRGKLAKIRIFIPDKQNMH